MVARANRPNREAAFMGAPRRKEVPRYRSGMTSDFPQDRRAPTGPPGKHSALKNRCRRRTPRRRTSRRRGTHPRRRGTHPRRRRTTPHRGSGNETQALRHAHLVVVAGVAAAAAILGVGEDLVQLPEHCVNGQTPDWPDRAAAVVAPGIATVAAAAAGWSVSTCRSVHTGRSSRSREGGQAWQVPPKHSRLPQLFPQLPQ